jgi:hypothetical protein
MYSSMLGTLIVREVLLHTVSCCPHTAVAAAAAVQTMGREHRNMDVPALIGQLKKSHRWHVETA